MSMQQQQSIIRPTPPRSHAAPVVQGTPISIAIRGRLDGAAVVRDTMRGSGVLLEVRLRQRVDHHPQALPVVAVLEVPDRGGYASTRAAADAQRSTMPDGAEVVVRGVGLETGTHQRTAVLRVIRCTTIVSAAQLREAERQQAGSTGSDAA